MGQTAKYCGECHALFSVLPVSQQSEKQKEFVSAGKFTVDYGSLKTETGACDECHEVKVVWFYPL